MCNHIQKVSRWKLFNTLTNREINVPGRIWIELTLNRSVGSGFIFPTAHLCQVSLHCTPDSTWTFSMSPLTSPYKAAHSVVSILFCASLCQSEGCYKHRHGGGGAIWPTAQLNSLTTARRVLTGSIGYDSGGSVSPRQKTDIDFIFRFLLDLLMWLWLWLSESSQSGRGVLV